MSNPLPTTIAELVSDPDTVLARLRAQGVVAPVEAGVLVVRYEGVRKMLQNPLLHPNFPATLERFGVHSGPFYDFMSRSPLNLEGERHRSWRQLMVRTFTPRRVDRLRPYMEREAERLLSEFIDDGQCEFVEAFARQLPSLGLCELIGVPKEDRPVFCEWADTIGLGFNPMLMAARIADVDAAMTNLLHYAAELVAARRKAPQDDLVSRLAEAVTDDAQGLTESSVAASVAGLVFAGHETTKNQLGWMMVVLAEAPQEWDRAAEDPAYVRPLVEELLRLRSAATNVGRTAAAEVQIGGVHIPKGGRVLASLWSANRDTEVFPRPDAIDVEANAAVPQIAFGQGAHHCLGAALARSELQEALAVLSRRLTCPRLLPGAEFLPPIGITGPTRLPIAFSKR